MNKGYKYKLLPTTSQAILLKNHMFSAHQTYNIILSLKEDEKYKNIIRKEQKLTPEYLNFKQIDDKVKDIIKSRELIHNTKVLQQERIRFI